MGHKATLVFLLKYLLGMVFLYAGTGKFLEHEDFYLNLYNMPLLPTYPFLPGFLSWAIAGVELLTGLWLLLPAYTRQSLGWASGVLILYTVYILALLWWAPSLPCSCMGVIKDASWEQHLILTLCCLGMGLGGFVMRMKQKR